MKVQLPPRKYPDYNQPFSEHYSERQNILYNKLLKAGISKKIANNAKISGYYMNSEDGFVLDSYYASMWALEGQFPFDYFLAILKKEKSLQPLEKKVSVVKSVNEILEILKSDPHSYHCLQNGSLSFRGQREEYFTERIIPNPSLADNFGKERLIIPNIYRKYKNDFQARIMDERPQEVFGTLLADDLIYYGMESPLVISERNHKKYGPHTISELQEFPEPENQEYYKRWNQIKIQGTFYPDIAIISQHYGFQTYGLDITFDPKVAAFFATHKFEQKENGKADYYPVNNGEHKGVIYCFYFRAPQITKTRDIVESIPAFEYIFPLRPVRQSCALPFFLPDRFNEACQFVWHVFKLDSEFKLDDLHSKEFLFPSKNEDKFYAAAIEVKQKNNVWAEFVEYNF
jgi:hypothetical protein